MVDDWKNTLTKITLPVSPTFLQACTFGTGVVLGFCAKPGQNLNVVRQNVYIFSASEEITGMNISDGLFPGKNNK